MRNRRALPALLAAALAAPLVAAGTPGGCGPLDGREVVRDGTTLSFSSPVATAPELNTTGAVTGDNVKHHRSATFFLRMDAAPGGAADLDVELAWADQATDYDLFLFDDRGREIARSAAATVQDGVSGVERLTRELDHCEDVVLAVRSWAGTPVETLQLSFGVTPVDDAGTTPITAEPMALYLGGDGPGNANNLADYVGDDAYPFATAMVAERPTEGVPDATTRPAAGFNDAMNPFVPHWTTRVDGLAVAGDASALVWVSSPTMDGDPVGTLTIDLYVDSTRHRVEVPGTELGDEPRPFLVRFPDVVDDRVRSVTLQVGAEPAASSSGGAGNPSNVNHTVWFGSVQYQSRVLLPVVRPADGLAAG